MLDRLYVELADGDLRLVKLAEPHREALRAACAADADIWPIYSSSFDPDHFDASFDTLIGHESRMPYAIIDGDRLVGMTAYLRPQHRLHPARGDRMGVGGDGLLHRLHSINGISFTALSALPVKAIFHIPILCD